MSLAELKSELRRMPRDERREVARLLIELEEESEPTARVAETFAEAKAYVFDNYGDLLRRLAQ
jgi:hypothetical protein